MKVGIPTWIALALLMAAAALSNSVLFRQDMQGKTENTRHIASTLGPWIQIDAYPPSLGEIHGLETSDIIKRVYANGPNTIELVVAYISHSSRKSAHAQEACLRGAGALVGSLESRRLTRSPVLVKSIGLDLNGQHQQIFYWYKIGNTYTADYLASSFKMFLGGLIGESGKGASLVRLLTPVRSGENPQAVNERLEDFTTYLIPELERTVP